jgi:hypothetical protein
MCVHEANVRHMATSRRQAAHRGQRTLVSRQSGHRTGERLAAPYLSRPWHVRLVQ